MQNLPTYSILYMQFDDFIESKLLKTSANWLLVFTVKNRYRCSGITADFFAVLFNRTRNEQYNHFRDLVGSSTRSTGSPTMRRSASRRLMRSVILPILVNFAKLSGLLPIFVKDSARFYPVPLRCFLRRRGPWAGPPAEGTGIPPPSRCSPRPAKGAGRGP